jgi:MFS family permease
MGVGLPYLAKTRFDSPTAYAVLVSALAGGGLLGALLAGIWRVRRRGILLLCVSVVISICIGSVALPRHLWLIAGVLLLMAASAGLANVNIAAWVQQRVDPAIRGRVLSVLMLSAYGLFPVSLAAAGFLVAWNVQWTFILAGAAMLLVTGFGALQKQVRDIE